MDRKNFLSINEVRRNTLNEEESNVLDIISRHGWDNKIKAKQIAYQVTTEDPAGKPGAGLRRIVNSLRQKGYAICSDSKGYWYAKSKSELLDNAEALRGRAVKILEAARGMERAVRDYNEPQKKMFQETL